MARTASASFLLVTLRKFCLEAPCGLCFLEHSQDTYTTHVGFSWTAEAAERAERPHPVTLPPDIICVVCVWFVFKQLALHSGCHALKGSTTTGFAYMRSSNCTGACRGWFC